MKTEKCLADLQLEVIYNEKCIKCGSCGAFCQNIYFENGDMKYKEQCSETVGVCYNFCPRSELNLPELDMKLFGKKREDQALGVFQRAVKATLKDESLKDVTAALLVAGMNAGTIDAAVMGNAAVDKVLDPVTCKDKNEVLANAGERKGLGPIVWGAGNAIREGFNKIAVVGRPCHAQGLGKILKNEDFLVNQGKIALVVSHFCLAQGKGCTLCTDYTGEFSDISLDAKTGVMLVRSDAGAALVKQAVDAGFISVEDVDPSEARETATKKKVKNFLKVLAKNGEMIPVDYLQLDLAGFKSLAKD